MLTVQGTPAPPSKVMHWEVNSSSRLNADLPATEVLPNLESLKLTRSSDSDIRASLRPPSRNIPPPTTAERDYSTWRKVFNLFAINNSTFSSWIKLVKSLFWHHDKLLLYFPMSTTWLSKLTTAGITGIRGCVNFDMPGSPQSSLITRT